ncbi:circadian clock KaiB family protein [Thiocapsa rosea]|uniref:Circadian clock protein KaiB n=1 Tax=Thiocapsa rosea TaxID=69360 RepID=A0A495V2N4_9GAMM|nr:circadian clock KaiB family protein [Thiocapsa rosea]RKT43594.1 circadian clock protein KaiB [Thiocapsa rosea]
MTATRLPACGLDSAGAMSTQPDLPRVDAAAQPKASGGHVLTLYVASLTPRSVAAIRSVKDVCEKHLRGRYDLEVIDIYEHPSLAKSEQIVAAPTLIKKLPLPLRRLIGDMADEHRVLVGLDLRPRDKAD